MKKIFFFVKIIILLAGCAQTPNFLEFPPSPRQPKVDDSYYGGEHSPISTIPAKELPTHNRFSATPVAPNTHTQILDVTDSKANELGELPATPIALNLENLPIPAFLNEVFGNTLRLNYHIDPKLQNAQDLVTLRIAEPQSAQTVYRLALQVLARYGISTVREDQLLRFVPAAANSRDVPFLIKGNTLPNVPISHRPIFLYIPLKVADISYALRWLRVVFTRDDYELHIDEGSHSLVIVAQQELAEKIEQVVRWLDQPNLRGKDSIRIDPVFLKVDALAKRLEELLKIQGYDVGPAGSVTLIPVQEINSLIMFANSREAIAYAREWVSALDQPKAEQQDSAQFFYYPAQNTKAESLLETLMPLIGGGALGASKKNAPSPLESAAPAAPALAPGADANPLTKPTGSTPSGLTSAATGAGKLVVDKNRNAIIYWGNYDEWQSMRAILERLDQPTKMVLIEVIIAEVILSNSMQTGVEFLLTGLGFGDYGGRLGTLGGIGPGQAGLSYILDSAGQTRAILNAFAANNRVSILSSPRLLTKNGEGASIQVGNEVPIISSQTASSQQIEGNSGILQQIQYRSTGLSLSVTPTVFAGNRVDLQISQSTSQAEANTLSNIDSPVILNRSISTNLTLRDGGSVLLGGLMTLSRSAGKSGIPFLKDIPGLGRLFSLDKEEENRTELVMLIVPYVIDNDQEAQALSKAFTDRLNIVNLPSQPSIAPTIAPPAPESVGDNNAAGKTD